MELMEYMRRHGYEQFVACHEPSVGLRAFIAIHDTTLGPACGGVRFWPHSSEDDAIMEVYAPDFVINAGGIINAAHEMNGVYRPEQAREVTERIFDTTERVIHMSRREEVPTYVAASRLAEKRLEAVRGLRPMYR